MKQFDEWYEEFDCGGNKWEKIALTSYAAEAFRAGMLAVADIVPNNYTQAEWKEVIENAIACKDEG